MYAHPMAAHDPERRREIAASGGRARADRDHDMLSAAGRAGAAKAHTPEALARRLVKKWRTGELSRAELAAVRTILAEMMPRPR